MRERYEKYRKKFGENTRKEETVKNTKSLLEDNTLWRAWVGFAG
jgi:hypothetical protein